MYELRNNKRNVISIWNKKKELGFRDIILGTITENLFQQGKKMKELEILNMK